MRITLEIYTQLCATGTATHSFRPPHSSMCQCIRNCGVFQVHFKDSTLRGEKPNPTTLPYLQAIAGYQNIQCLEHEPEDCWTSTAWMNFFILHTFAYWSFLPHESVSSYDSKSHHLKIPKKWYHWSGDVNNRGWQYKYLTFSCLHQGSVWFQNRKCSL